MKNTLDPTMENEKVSFVSILKSFRYWPNLFKLLWETHRGYFFCVLILNFLNGLLPASLILSIKYLVNMVQNLYTQGYKDNYFYDILPFFIFFSVVTLLTSVTGSILETHKQLYRNLLSNKINVKLIEKAKRLPYASFENPEVYNKLQRARQDSTYKPFAIFEELMGIVKGAITLISISIILMVWNWEFTLILILLPLISAWSIVNVGKEIFLVSHKRAEETRKQFYYYYLMTTDITVKEVKIFGLGSLLLRNYSDLFSKFYNQDRHLLLKKMRIDLSFQLISVVFVIFIQFMIVRDTIQGLIAIGSLIAYFQAVNTTQKTSNELMYMIFNMHQNNLYMTQLFSFLNVPENTAKPSVSEKKTLENISSVEKGIQFLNVSFKYPGQENYTLKNVNFYIKPGETLALVGSNGSGKSTIVKLLTRLYTDYEGLILLDGKRIEDYQPQDWQDRISAIFQDFVRYELDVKENIGYGDYKRSNHLVAIQAAAKRSGALTMIDSLPDKMDTQLGKTFANGIQLSGGQWQRIAIARAYMRRASLYILDEPTAALDPAAEEEVFQDFQEIAQKSMGLFISHRYSTVKYADRIMVLDKGKVAEYGTHVELLDTNGIYARLFNLQAKSYIEASATQASS
ncbi:ABC transporter ATP-binding protein [Priestia aryabhattai]|uniref:ABC transporter ATP-binding protein n=1 Tax=Priestia aryabhattai TaxID=412384 RepID=UPI0030C94F54